MNNDPRDALFELLSDSHREMLRNKTYEKESVTLSVPKYKGSFLFDWEDGFVIRSWKEENGAVCIEANKAGMISLARHLLEMAQDDVPEFMHFHLDGFFGPLEEGSTELILVKRNFSPTESYPVQSKDETPEKT